MTGDKVDHPNHYQSDKVEAIDVIAEFTKDLSGVQAFDIGNAFKYLCRFTRKNGTEDLRKAVWYIQHAINNMEESK